MLLTGAGGFVGRALAARLEAAGHGVRGSDLEGGEGIAAVDLRDRGAVADWVGAEPFDVAIHAGAISGQMVVGRDIARVFDVNVGGTVNLLAALGAGRLVHLSSNAVYRGPGGGEGTAEDAPLFSAEPYGASKVAAEATVAAWAEAEGLAAVVLRVSSVYGPGRRTPYLMSAILDAAAAGRVAEVTGPAENFRQFLHVDDLTAAICAALPVLAALPPGRVETFNIAGAEWVPESAIGAIFARHLPGLRLAEVPLAGGPAEGAGGRLDCRFAAARLGWRPAISLEQGIAALVAARMSSQPGESP